MTDKSNTPQTIKKPNFSLGNKPLAKAALKMAVEHHAGITRKFSGEPYVNHPIRVAERILAAGYTDDRMIAAALLHDCVEDENRHGHKMDQHLVNLLDPKVGRWVAALTNDCKGKDRATRKRRYGQRIAQSPPEVIAIKLADVMDNCTGCADDDVEFAHRYLKEKMDFLQQLPKFVQDDRLISLMESCNGVLNTEMNKVALEFVRTGKEKQAEEARRDVEIDAILEADEYADLAGDFRF